MTKLYLKNLFTILALMIFVIPPGLLLGQTFSDTENPTTGITSPLNGAVVNGIVPILATGCDNVGVSKVEFYRTGNVLMMTDTTSPYSYNWDTTFCSSPQTLTTKAYDAAGNNVISSPITVTLNNPTPPTNYISINDVSISEGNSGTKTMTFTVSVAPVNTCKDITLNYTTAYGSATPGSDYISSSGPLTIPAGSSSVSVNVTINGDTAIECNETLFVNLSGAINGVLADSQGQGTILNDDFPSLSINDKAVIEPDSGQQTTATFTLTLTATSPCSITVNYQTGNGTATGGSDYVTVPLTPVTIPANTLTKTINITVSGDTLYEFNETYFVNIINPSGGGVIITDGQGLGTITNNDPMPTLTVNDVSVTEGNSGNTSANFTITQSAVSGVDTTVKVDFSDVTATYPSDYGCLNPGGGCHFNLVIPAGSISKIVNAYAVGDTLHEINEAFDVNLSLPVNATIADGNGRCTIVNDDP